MTFSPLCKAILVSTLIISTPTLSADLSQTKQQAQRVSEELNHSYHGQIGIEGFKVNAVKHQFIFGHGIVLSVSTNIDELVLQKKSPLPVMIKQDQHQTLTSKSLEGKEAKQTLNELRLQARNIAHQEFSLQKQINSMQAQSLQSQSEQQKDTIDQKIRANQDKMKNLITEKRQVSKAIDDYSKMVEESSARSVKVSRDKIYTTLVKQSYHKLCNDLSFVSQLAENEQLTLVFKGLGDAEATGYKDRVINIDKDILTQCNNGNVSAEQALKQSYSYQY